MADKLTAEEEAKARELKQKTSTEKSKLDQIVDGVSEMTDLLKSQAGEKKPDEDPKKDDLDMDLSVEDMAKAIMASEDPNKMFKSLLEHCDVGLENILDENQERYYSDEMLKSLEDSTEKTDLVLNGVIQAGKAANERYAKAYSVNAKIMLSMMKSFGGMVSEMSEMKKSMTPPVAADPVIEKEIDTPLGDGAAVPPKSLDTDLNATGAKYTTDQMTSALKKSFQDTDPVKYHTYTKQLRKLGGDADLFYSHLDGSNSPSIRDDASTMFIHLIN